jgi:hypothetical protein
MGSLTLLPFSQIYDYVYAESEGPFLCLPPTHRQSEKLKAGRSFNLEI